MTDINLKRIARLAERKGIVAECHSSGLSVKAWCAAHDICAQTYYRWEKNVIAEASGRLQVQNEIGTVPATVSSTPVFAELDPVKATPQVRSSAGAIATIQCGNIRTRSSSQLKWSEVEAADVFFEKQVHNHEWKVNNRAEYSNRVYPIDEVA